MAHTLHVNKALKQQQNEIDDFTIYSMLSLSDKNKSNQTIFRKIAKEEQGHYTYLKTYTHQELQPRRYVVLFYLFLSKIVGISFTLKFLEGREEGAKAFYKELILTDPKAQEIYEQEIHHEIELIDMLHDKKLLYAGAIVLGMNDALVELTGTLSGIALAFDKSMVVGVTGLIMGIAASLSMAGSAYLESKENVGDDVNPLTYSLYTGVSYILTTAILVAPFFIFEKISIAIIWMFGSALVAIFLYNFYISVAKDLSFWKRVREMSYITFGVALISFGIGYVVKHYFGIEI
ncbi:VIT1/CCC1 transporter family protein [Sulfurospirillum multivorans]|uniref:Ferritin-like protein n=2 Tax=Sulfurospirillum multivorans TaxID=66821 RepID=A0AA86ANJ8_SULMK|nr:VIT1/CCC1 family protein [Sulfurospirillum multivorans]AHJ12718.1 ferritin-like protein [Sulfurospirillum multivorans DSM 12446]QEH06213.1 ferritin-like protein [Sulfurospirillum multivorans]